MTNDAAAKVDPALQQDTAVQVRGYLLVFGALLALTVITVAVSYMQMPTGPAIALGLAIATAKAALVAMFFMHLNHERQLIYVALLFTGFFFAALIGLTLWSETDHVPGTEFTAPFSTRPASEPQPPTTNH
jgi:cytochrome c oxidase subunit 4